MIFKKNRYLLHFLALIILASCSTTSKNLIPNSNEILKGNSLKNFEDIYDYQSYFEIDLEKIQKAIDNQQLNQEELKNAKILKRNYQKILSNYYPLIAVNAYYYFNPKFVARAHLSYGGYGKLNTGLAFSKSVKKYFDIFIGTNNIDAFIAPSSSFSNSGFVGFKAYF